MKDVFKAENRTASADTDYLLGKKTLIDFNDFLEPSKKPDPFKNIQQTVQDLFDKNLLKQAEKLLSALHAKGWGTDETYCLLGVIYYQQNQFKKSLLAYKKALEKNSSHLESLVNLSLLRLDLGDYDKGFFVYKKAMECLFQNKENQWKQYITRRHLHSGQVYFQRGYYHEALLEFLKACPDQNKPLKVNINIIRCLWNLDRKHEAFQKLLNLKKLNPVSIPVALLLGEFYFHVRKIPLAINEWEKVLRFDPDNQQAIHWLSKVQNIQSVKEGPLA